MRLRRRAEEIVDLVGRTETEFRVSADNPWPARCASAAGRRRAWGSWRRPIAGLQGDYPLIALQPL